jgi:mono/diheme cytochrome c family protein
MTTQRHGRRVFVSPKRKRGVCCPSLALRANNGMVRGTLICSILLLTTGCQQEMARQPSYRKLAPSDFFEDGRSARPLEPGTVARGYLRTDAELYTGLESGSANPRWAATVTGLGMGGPWVALGAIATGPRYVRQMPYPFTEDVLERGRERYNIYCAVCHDRVGTGKGRIVMRGYLKPPSYHSDKLRTMPDGYIFSIITNGNGAMPSYESQIPPHDRWAIVAYVRALQLSQNFPEDQLTEQERADLPKEAAP